jgi:hypothetical protein
MEPYGIVYGLYDPVTGALRYIGQTTSSLAGRLSRHLSPSGLRRHLYVACWLRGLVQRGKVPKARVLHRAGTREELDRLEVTSIQAARAEGHRLTNLALGGRVNAGFKKSKEACAKIAAARRGTVLSAETKAKISAAMQQRVLTPTHRARIGAASRGRVRTKAARDKQSRSRRDPNLPDRQIRILWLCGYTHQEIADKFGVSRTCISKRLARFNMFR